MKGLVVGLPALAVVGALAGAAATGWTLGGILWTSAPALLGVAPLALARSRNREVRYAATAFAATATVVLAAFHVAWCLLLMRGGSSGSIPVFVFAPFYAFGAASLVSVVATAVAVVRDYRLYRRPPG
jgi:hypothetical protein